LETRDKLRDLLSKVDRSDKLESVLEQILTNTEQLKQLSSQLGEGESEGSEPQRGES
jgi:type VI secretion system protein ImpB